MVFQGVDRCKELGDPWQEPPGPRGHSTRLGLAAHNLTGAPRSLNPGSLGERREKEKDSLTARL